MTNKLTIAAQTIKDRISALEVGNAIGLEIKHGRCQCPFHGGKDFNCVLYKGNRGWYCHVCKSGGDVLSFAQQYYKFSFKDCIAWYNATFHMGLDIEGKIDPQKKKQAEIALQRRKRAREMQEWKEQMQFNLFLLAEKLVDRLENDRDEHRPKTYGAWDEAFCTSVKLLPYARQFAEDCMMDCIKENEAWTTQTE